MRGAVSVNLERGIDWLTTFMPVADKRFWAGRMATLNGSAVTNDEAEG